MQGALPDITDEEIQQRIQELGLTHPRVTPERIEWLIVKDEYHVIGTTTICILHLQNGYKVLGQSACVDPRNFNKELGERIARKKAKEQIWPLEGYVLQEFQHIASLRQAERLDP